MFRKAPLVQRTETSAGGKGYTWDIACRMDSNSVLEGLSRGAMDVARRQVSEKQVIATLCGWSLYQRGGWQRERTVARKAQVLVHPDKEDPRARCG